MPKQRIAALDYIRGISALGVVGIHTGSYSLSNPQVNIHLFALLEIVTRFSVPIFFYVSAFGLFWGYRVGQPFSYRDFMRRRLRTVLLPYISWSVLYMIYNTFATGNLYVWHPLLLVKYLFFGLASYQLYFLVILLWFYILMPLWHQVVNFIIQKPVRRLSWLLIFQIIFNYYSSYKLQPVFSNHFINMAVEYRMSYWLVHYLFIFLLGAVCAIKYDDLTRLLKKYPVFPAGLFAGTLAGMLSFYYYLLFNRHYTPEQAVNTAHQLSPIGVLYTLAAALFLFALFNNENLPHRLAIVLDRLGRYSYPIYLVHPFFMYLLGGLLAAGNCLMTAKITLIFYFLTVAGSIAFSAGLRSLPPQYSFINLLLTGAARKSNPSINLGNR